MFDQLIGLLLLGIGVNKGIYAPNPNVKGDETVATDSRRLPPLPPVKNAFRLNPQNFVGGEGDDRKDSVASRAGTKKPIFNARAFGKGVLEMQKNFKDAMEASREAAKREFEDNKAAFKQQLAKIKDTRKQAIVEKLNTNCQNVNTKRTDKMTEMLGKLSSILTNVTNRAASASANGKNTSTVDTAVATAQTAIADAQSAVAAQAGTTCTITITTETNVKIDVGKAISDLQQNLKSVHEKVIAARKAVGDAVKALALVLGEPLTHTPTPTPTP